VATVGAGDAFNAGFLTGLFRKNALSKLECVRLSNADLQYTLNFATAFATDTVTRQGSNPAWNFES
jgi:fructokinase